MEKIKNAPFLQIFFFLYIYKQLISLLVFFIDASKNNYIGFAIYSLSPHLQLLFKSHSYSSIFSRSVHYSLYSEIHSILRF